jgi:hypothetical protein
MVKILGREIFCKKNDGQQAARYNFSETTVQPALEKRGALRMVFNQATIRDSADFELDGIEVRIQNLYDEIQMVAPGVLTDKCDLIIEKLGGLTDKQKDGIRDLKEQIEILFMYRSLLFRCTHIGARYDPNMQKKLAALYRLLERKLKRPSYRPRLRVLINYLWSTSFRLKEGETPPPILIETPQVFPIKQGGGQGLNKIPEPGEENEEN